MPPPEIETAPLKPQFAKSVLSPMPHIEIFNSNKEYALNACRIAAATSTGGASASPTVESPTCDAGYSSVQWGTICATSCLSSSFGVSQTTFFIESVGDGTKPLIVGFVPRSFTAFNSKLHEGGGWGVASTGKIYGPGLAGAKHQARKIPCSVNFVSGDRVTLKLEAHRGHVTVTVENKKKQKQETSFSITGFQALTAAGGGMVVPAVSLACPGAGVAIETIVDATPLELFSQRIVGNQPSIGGTQLSIDASFDDGSDVADGFGPFWLRLACRMKDTDTVKASSSVVLSRNDVKLRTLLTGHQCQMQGNSVMGVLVPDVAAKRQQTIFNKFLAELFSSQDGAGIAKLREQVKRQQKDWSSGNGLATISPTTMLLACVIQQMEQEQQQTAKQITEVVASLQADMKEMKEKIIEECSSPTGPFREMSPVTASSANLLGPHTARSGETGGKNPARGSNTDGDSDMNQSAHLPSLTRKGTTVKTTQNSGARRPSLVPGKSTTTTVKAGGKTPRPPVARPQPKKAARPSTSQASTNNKAIVFLRNIRTMMEQRVTMGEKGSPTDRDLAELDALKKKIAKEKPAAAKELAACDKAILNDAVSSEEKKEELIDMMEELTQEGDQHPGNSELVKAIIKYIPLDWPAAVSERQLAITAAYDGSMEYLNIFLSLPKLSIDVVELMQSSMFNQICRIPAVLTVLKYEQQLGLAKEAEELADVWQEFFEDIASNARSQPKEVRTGRMELLLKMVQHKTFKLDMENEGADGQTPFSRACREGDMPLIKMLLSKDCPYPININRQQSDTMTPLIQAVVANNVEVVRLLLSLPHINAGIVSQEGSAQTIAVSLKRSQDIVKMLEKLA